LVLFLLFLWPAEGPGVPWVAYRLLPSAIMPME
jgi:hypothetical protein